MPRFIISVTNDLITDQRVRRTCDCLDELGYEIILIGTDQNQQTNFSAKYATVLLKTFFNRGFLFYAEYNIRLLFQLLAKKKDYLYANDLDTLPANFIAGTIGKIPLIYDSHEYFTEVPELINRRKTRGFWLLIEQLIFPRLNYVITVNQALANIYSKKYQVPVTVVKNVPKRLNNHQLKKLNKKDNIKKTIIYQGSLNMDRGLELLIDAMAFLTEFNLIIAGDGYLKKKLQKRSHDLGLDSKISFLGKVSPDKLPAYTQMAHVGVSLEEKSGLSYTYSLPNKVFDYINCGIPILVSDLPLLKEIVHKYDLGEILYERTPQGLAKKIDHIVRNHQAYESGIAKANQDYTWEKEKNNLIKLIGQIE